MASIADQIAFVFSRQPDIGRTRAEFERQKGAAINLGVQSLIAGAQTFADAILEKDRQRFAQETMLEQRAHEKEMVSIRANAEMRRGMIEALFASMLDVGQEFPEVNVALMNLTQASMDADPQATVETLRSGLTEIAQSDLYRKALETRHDRRQTDDLIRQIQALTPLLVSGYQGIESIRMGDISQAPSTLALYEQTTKTADQLEEMGALGLSVFLDQQASMIRSGVENSVRAAIEAGTADLGGNPSLWGSLGGIVMDPALKEVLSGIASGEVPLGGDNAGSSDAIEAAEEAARTGQTQATPKETPESRKQTRGERIEERSDVGTKLRGVGQSLGALKSQVVFGRGGKLDVALNSQSEVAAVLDGDPGHVANATLKKVASIPDPQTRQQIVARARGLMRGPSVFDRDILDSMDRAKIPFTEEERAQLLPASPDSESAGPTNLDVLREILIPRELKEKERMRERMEEERERRENPFDIEKMLNRGR